MSFLQFDFMIGFCISWYADGEGTNPVGSARANNKMTVGRFNSGKEKYGQFDLDEWFVWD